MGSFADSVFLAGLQAEHIRWAAIPPRPCLSPSSIGHPRLLSHPALDAGELHSSPVRATVPKNLGEIDMRDIAPTLRQDLKVSLPQAGGKPLL